MADDFWGQVFARLHEDIDLLSLICEDTSDIELISWIKPNPMLWNRCARFVQRKKISNKPGLIVEVLNFAKKEQSLRKIIFFNWVEKNAKTMSFTSLASTPEALSRVTNGEFGSLLKIRILARIDPREGIEQFYSSCISQMHRDDKSENAAEPGEVKVQDSSISNLEQEIKKLRNDLKDAKRDYEIRAKEISGLQRALAERDQTIENLVKENAGLLNRVKKQELENVTLNPDQVQVSIKFTDNQNSTHEEVLTEKLSYAEEKLADLVSILQRRDQRISKLQRDLSELKTALSIDEDKDRKIDNLQRLLNQSDSEASSTCISGQILNIDGENGKRQWFLQSFAGEIISLPAEYIREKMICLAEFCTVFSNENGELTRLESLETEKKTILGYLSESEHSVKLISNGQKYEVFCKLAKKHDNRPMKAIFLNEFQNRPAGIYELAPVNITEKQAKENKVVNVKTAMEFLGISICSKKRLIEAIEMAGIPVQQMPNETLKFTEDFRRALSVARMSLTVEPVCSNPVCQKESLELYVGREPSEGEPCKICHQLKIEGQTIPRYDFNGKKIRIFGGDYVGNDYKEFLSQFNLNVSWESGFQNLKNYGSGLGKVDLVVLVLRQLSHTLLREIVQICQRENIPILYCKKRGTTGLLLELRNYFCL